MPSGSLISATTRRERIGMACLCFRQNDLRTMIKLRILGCSGGIGGNARTTAMLLDHDVLIDAGTGVGDLSLSELSLIDHVFITHSHLDHIACIPLLMDNVK